LGNDFTVTMTKLQTFSGI